jgi:hypothetical protein
MTNEERLKTDTVFVDAVIRECATLTIQHETDQQRIEALAAHIVELEQRRGGDTTQATKACEEAQERARAAEQKLARAVGDLHFVMSGGDPCKVCTVKCLMGEGNCKPVWRGEVAGQ